MSGIDYGWQWLAQAARDPESTRMRIRGVRLGDVILDGILKKTIKCGPAGRTRYGSSTLILRHSCERDGCIAFAAPTDRPTGGSTNVRRCKWRIEERPDGWRLAVVRKVPLRVLRPTWPPILLPLALLLEFLVWMDWGWFPLSLEDYSRANGEWIVRASGGRVDVPDGSFELSCLRSTKVRSDGALDGWVRLVFSGSVVPEAALVDWPGLPPSDAEELLAAVLERVSGRGVS